MNDFPIFQCKVLSYNITTNWVTFAEIVLVGMVGWQVDFWISYYQKCKKSKVKQYLWETGHMFTKISEECIAKKYFHLQFYHELIFFISCNCLIHENIVIKIRTDVRSLYYLSLKFWLFNFVKNLKVFSHVCFMSIRGKVMCIGLFL